MTSGWIAVGERLPEAGVKVLVFVAGRADFGIAPEMVVSDCERWTFTDGAEERQWYDREGRLLARVTHWMELPEPPAERGK